MEIIEHLVYSPEVRPRQLHDGFFEPHNVSMKMNRPSSQQCLAQAGMMVREATAMVSLILISFPIKFSVKLL